MTSIYKQSVGVDCSKDELVVCYGQLNQQFESNLRATTSFANGPSGFNQLLKWADELAAKDIELLFVVEATGVYHQHLAYELHSQGRSICVVLPSRANYFAKTSKSTYRN